MRRLSLLCAAAGLTVTALAATSPAQAAFSIIRYDNSGFCQVWDDTMKLPPPAGVKMVSKKPMATLPEALAAKNAMVAAKACSM